MAWSEGAPEPPLCILLKLLKHFRYRASDKKYTPQSNAEKTYLLSHVCKASQWNKSSKDEIIDKTWVSE